MRRVEQSKHRRKIMRLFYLLAISTFFFASCGSEDKSIASDLGQKQVIEADEREQLAALRSQIEELVGDAPCDTVADCRFVGFGSKSCGGPWKYLVYSVIGTDMSAGIGVDTGVDTLGLVEKVQAYNALEAEMNARYGYASDCAVVNEPVLGVEAGHCVDLNDPTRIVHTEPGGVGGDAPLDTLALVDGLGVDIKSDPFTFGGARVEGDLLVVEVSYGGGCEQHDFTLLDTGIATRSIPPQHFLRLVHDAHGDACEAYITSELRFDISPFKGLYSGLDRVAIRLEGMEELTLYIF
jgi:hypothetical protein